MELNEHYSLDCTHLLFLNILFTTLNLCVIERSIPSQRVKQMLIIWLCDDFQQTSIRVHIQHKEERHKENNARLLTSSCRNMWTEQLLVPAAGALLLSALSVTPGQTLGERKIKPWLHFLNKLISINATGLFNDISFNISGLLLLLYYYSATGVSVYPQPNKPFSIMHECHLISRCTRQVSTQVDCWGGGAHCGLSFLFHFSLQYFKL